MRRSFCLAFAVLGLVLAVGLRTSAQPRSVTHEGYLIVTFGQVVTIEDLDCVQKGTIYIEEGGTSGSGTRGQGRRGSGLHS
jgi:hypothetical protein